MRLAWRPKRRRVRLGTRLLISVMLPVVAFTALAGFDALQRYHEAAAASRVQAQVTRVELALRLEVSLVLEDNSTEFAIVSASYGLSTAQASTFLGLDLTARLQTARSAVDAALAANPGSAVDSRVAQLHALRAQVDQGVVADSAVRSLFNYSISAAESAWLSQLAVLRRMTTTMPAAAATRQAVIGLQDLAEGFTQGSDETPAAASLAVPALPGVADPRQDLAIAVALYTRATAGLDAELGVRGRSAWRKLIVADPDVKVFDQYVAGLLKSPSGARATLDMTQVAKVFRSGLIRQDRLVQVIDAATSDVTSSAEQFGRRAHRDFNTFVFAMAIMAGLSVAVSVITARAIVRPLRRLADRASEVSSGMIDGEPLPLAGPLEMAVVSEAFNETVANLRAVSAATLALASADFDSAVLQTSVPGQIGVSLRHSVTRLAQSIRDNEAMRHSLARNEKRFRVMFESNPLPMWVYDADTLAFLEVNQAAITAYGYAHAQFLGMRITDLLPDGELDQPTADEPRAPIRDGLWRHLTRSGRIIEVQVITRPLDFAQRPGVLVMAEDATERLAAERSLIHQAMHDALTGLPNRVLLLDRLEQAIARSDRVHGDVGVVFIDLDRFKVVNDAKGHTSGDLLLVNVAARIRTAIRPADTVARFGGDEFVVVLEDIDGAVEASAISDRIRSCLEEPFAISGSDLVVTASQGIVIARSGDTAEDLLRTADAAMYLAKEHGRSRTEVADDDLRTRASRRLQLEADMRRGLDAGEFIVYYQPVVDLADGSIIGAEALVRWDDPARGLVSPDDFIPIAEETGLILPLGAQVLAQALHEAAGWPAPLADGVLPTIAINISGRQLAVPRLANVVADAISTAGVDPTRVHLEVTESILIPDIDRSASVLRAIAALGVHISIDDFGTGYSSLSYLQKLPIDILKVDKSFIDLLGAGGGDPSIVTAVINLARSLGIDVVAEGVESVEQWRQLQQLSCHAAQGYYFAKPLPAPDFAALLITSPRLGNLPTPSDVSAVLAAYHEEHVGDLAQLAGAG